MNWKAGIFKEWMMIFVNFYLLIRRIDNKYILFDSL